MSYLTFYVKLFYVTSVLLIYDAENSVSSGGGLLKIYCTVFKRKRKCNLSRNVPFSGNYETALTCWQCPHNEP